MKIAESNVRMASGRSYTQVGQWNRKAAGQTAADFGGMLRSGMGDTGGRDAYTSTGSYYKEMESFNMNYYGMGSTDYSEGMQTTAATSVSTDGEDFFETLRYRLLMLLLRRLDLLGKFGGFGAAQNGGMGAVQRGMEMATQMSMSYGEFEDTTFFADGQARTEDGRVIDFQVEMLMSRSYMEYTRVQVPLMSEVLCDPLVINVGSGVTNISDQKFRFDLDADGEEDEISMLGEGSGFLALDKNGDGSINDGSELFGVKSGDGFGELREYDEDGNGWIDENDEIFNKLKVWCMDESGKEVLMDLKKADVGAIFLGEQKTEFGMRGPDGLNAQLRSTGVFLKESGGVGTIQHVDMAKG